MAVQLSAGVLSLAALMSWAAWGINLAITIIVQRHVSHRGSVMGTPSSTNNVKFQWGAVMPLALIAAVSSPSAPMFPFLVIAVYDLRDCSFSCRSPLSSASCLSSWAARSKVADTTAMAPV